MQTVTLGLDLGTSGVKALAVTPQGTCITTAYAAYPLLTPQPGWTEQNPGAWVKACLYVLRRVAHAIDGCTVEALGLSGQMHGMVPLNADGHVVRPAILWNDQRTADIIPEIHSHIDREVLIDRTGNPAITGFQLAKILWLQRHEPDAFAQTKRILLPKDYIGYVLTGQQVTEPSDASGVGCLNLYSQEWDTDILNTLNLPASLFPPLVGSTDIIGYLKSTLADYTGLPEGLPIIAGGSDNAAAAIGLGISRAQPKRGSLSIGSSGVIFAPIDTPTPAPDGSVHLFCHVDGGYHLLGVTLAAGDSLRWYRETLAAHYTYSQLMELASLSPPGSQGVLFLPHLAGERSPYLDPQARGSWVNLALAHEQGDLVRSILEGVAYSLRTVLNTIQLTARVRTLVATGGGIRSTVWRHILADVLEMPLILPAQANGAAYGAAVLAMVGAQIYPDLDACLQALERPERTLAPQPQPSYLEGFHSSERLYVTLRAFRKLNQKQRDHGAGQKVEGRG
ncbi:MAG: xylulokinase [Cyanobacteria bacterium J06559_3]